MTNQLLVDTNIVSFAFKGDSRIQLYQTALNTNELFISIITLAELRVWSTLHNWQKTRQLQLDAYIEHTFSLVGISSNLAQEWANVIVACRRQGRPISSEDAWIAATSLALNIPLVTHNPKDFAFIRNLDLVTFA